MTEFEKMMEEYRAAAARAIHAETGVEYDAAWADYRALGLQVDAYRAARAGDM